MRGTRLPGRPVRFSASERMQQVARAAAARAAATPLRNPAVPGAFLPAVPNGLGAGGLQLAGPPVGALNPVQSGAGGAAPARVTVKQTAQQALLNWSSFNVGAKTNLHFDQSAGGANKNQWIAFNQVNDPTGQPSQILGSIDADGQVYVINQNGIIFGGASQVNVHTLVAASLPINENLISRGLLNNPTTAQFLFSGLPQAGDVPFTPPRLRLPGGKYGDVTVLRGRRPDRAHHRGECRRSRRPHRCQREEPGHDRRRRTARRSSPQDCRSGSPRTAPATRRSADWMPSSATSATTQAPPPTKDSSRRRAGASPSPGNRGTARRHRQQHVGLAQWPDRTAGGVWRDGEPEV